MKTSLILCATVLATCSVLAADKKEKTPAKPAASTATAAPETPAAPAPAIKDVTPDEVEKILKTDPKVVVLDVRTPEEFEEGHLKGAQNMDVQSDSFADQLKQLDKDKTYVLHCAAGGRSSRVLNRMRELDFKSVYHMNGGVSAWKEAGKPLVK